jgi:hypothetical protein
MKLELKQLRDLEIGDKFYPASQHGKAAAKVFFIVDGKPEFNIRHGSATRLCINLTHKVRESKSCRMEVMKMQTPENKS